MKAHYGNDSFCWKCLATKSAGPLCAWDVSLRANWAGFERQNVIFCRTCSGCKTRWCIFLASTWTWSKPTSCILHCLASFNFLLRQSCGSCALRPIGQNPYMAAGKIRLTTNWGLDINNSKVGAKPKKLHFAPSLLLRWHQYGHNARPAFSES